MPSLNNLPVELVVELLKGASLEVILNVTRTSTFFRSIGRSSRLLWVNAQDVDKLPLPAGETIHTVTLSSISRLAAYAASLSNALRGPVAQPRHVTDIESLPPGLRQLPGLMGGCHMYNGSILPGNQWLLIDMQTNSPHLFCIANGEFLPLFLQGTVVSYVYESRDNGSSVVLALLREVWTDDPNSVHGYLDVFVFQFRPAVYCPVVPRVRSVLSLRIPRPDFTCHVGLKGSLVVASCGNRLFIVDWNERSGVQLSPSLEPPPAKEDDLPWYFVDFTFHPDHPILFGVKCHRPGNSVHSIEYPAALPRFHTDDLTHEFIWHTELLVSTEINSSQLLSQKYIRFRGRAYGPPTLELICCNDTNAQLDFLSILHPEDRTPETLYRQVEAKGMVLERPTTAGYRSCLAIDVSKNEVYFLKFPPTPYMSQGPTWIRLVLPEEVRLEDLDGDQVLAFDDVYGRLLLDDTMGNYLLVQY